MPAERHHPIDAIGNHVREGGLLHVTVPNNSTLGQVIKVEPAGMLRGPDGKPIAMDGRIMVLISIPYRPGRNLPNVLVVQQPDQQREPVMIVNDKEAAELIGERKN